MTQVSQKGEEGGNGGVPYFSGQNLNWHKTFVVRLLTGADAVLGGGCLT